MGGIGWADVVAEKLLWQTVGSGVSRVLHDARATIVPATGLAINPLFVYKVATEQEVPSPTGKRFAQCKVKPAVDILPRASCSSREFALETSEFTVKNKIHDTSNSI